LRAERENKGLLLLLPPRGNELLTGIPFGRKSRQSRQRRWVIFCPMFQCWMVCFSFSPQIVEFVANIAFGDLRFIPDFEQFKAFMLKMVQVLQLKM
jgi:hypothetical protein